MCCARSVGKFQSPILFAAIAASVSLPMRFNELHRRSHFTDGSPHTSGAKMMVLSKVVTSLNFIIARARRDGNGKRE